MSYADRNRRAVSTGWLVFGWVNIAAIPVMGVVGFLLLAFVAPAALLAMREVFGDLGQDAKFVAAVERAYAALAPGGDMSAALR